MMRLSGGMRTVGNALPAPASISCSAGSLVPGRCVSFAGLSSRSRHSGFGQSKPSAERPLLSPAEGKPPGSSPPN
jgi:hypothetical protein